MSGVRRRGKKWVARLTVGGHDHTVGVCGSEETARACLAVHLRKVADGSSPYLMPNTMALKAYAESIAVRYGTVKRWVGEGLPVVHAGTVVLVRTDLAKEWVEDCRQGGVAFARKAVVYFAERESDHAIKIGWTSNVGRRLSELRKDEGTDVILLAAIPGDKLTELAMHERFAADLIELEWFRPSERLVEFISGLGRSAA